jgi:DNA-binding HxlR family transcriptional regulator
MSSQKKLSSLQMGEDIRDLTIRSIKVSGMSQLASNSNYVDGIVRDASIAEIFNEEEFLKLPNQIFNPYRLLILSTLWRWGSLDFSALGSGVQIKSDGNLANHLKVLEDLGLIAYKKEFDGRRPKTFYELTENGKKIFKDLKFHLRTLSADEP